MNKHELFEENTKRDCAPTKIQSEERKEVTPVPCAEWAEKIESAFPGGFSTIDRVEFERHTVSCKACASVLTDYEAMLAILQAFPIPEPPLGLPSRLLQLWEDESQQDEMRHTSWKRAYQLVARRENSRSNGIDVSENEVDQKTAILMNFYKPIRWHANKPNETDDRLVSRGGIR